MFSPGSCAVDQAGSSRSLGARGPQDPGAGQAARGTGAMGMKDAQGGCGATCGREGPGQVRSPSAAPPESRSTSPRGRPGAWQGPPAALTVPRSRLHRPAARTAARSGDRRRPRPGTARPRPLRGQGAGLASAAANGERSGAGSVGAAGAGRCGGGGASSGLLLLLLQGGELEDPGIPSACRPHESPPVAYPSPGSPGLLTQAVYIPVGPQTPCRAEDSPKPERIIALSSVGIKPRSDRFRALPSFSPTDSSSLCLHPFPNPVPPPMRKATLPIKEDSLELSTHPSPSWCQITEK